MPAAKKKEAEIEISASLYGGGVTIQRGNFGRLKHAYYWVEQNKFIPGVTSVLGILDKPALLPWAAGQATEYVRANLPEGATKAQIKEVCEKAKTEWRRVRDEAGDIGSAVHAVAEAIFNGLPIELPQDERAQNGVKALQTWIVDNRIRPIETELIVFSKSCYVAGTMDLLADVNGKLTQVDFKTGSGIYPEHLFQTGIYRHAWMEEHGEPIEQNIIVNLNKRTGEPKIVIISDRDELQFHADTFLRCKALSENLRKMGVY